MLLCRVAAVGWAAAGQILVLKKMNQRFTALSTLNSLSCKEAGGERATLLNQNFCCGER